MENYDVVVIGGGPAGYPSAIRCAQNGLKVALIEKSSLGGCCLNTGCIPTKTLFKVARILNKSVITGVNCETSFDWKKVLQHVKSNVVARLRTGVGMLLKANGISHIQAEAMIKEPNVVLAGDTTLKTKKIIIATGSKPFIPEIFCNDQRVITTDKIWDLEKLPETLAIVGAGPVGCEFASIFSCFGVRITIYEMLDTILPGRDKEIVGILEKEFAKKEIQVKTNIKINCADEIGEEKVLWAGGRKPFVDIANDIGLIMNKTGIEVDSTMKTSLPDIYAAGDVTGKWQLAYVATRQGEVAAENCAGKQQTISYDNIPETIFTMPEIGSVGITEVDAQKNGLKIKVGRFPYMALGKAHTAGDTAGLAKVIVDSETDRLLGVHITGEQASEIIHAACIGISRKMTVKEMLNVYWSHPTFSEILMEALLVAQGNPLHIPIK